MGEFDEALDYPFLVSVDEALELVIENAEAARQANNGPTFGLRLVMASRALRCAMKMYGDWSQEKVRTEEKT